MRGSASPTPHLRIGRWLENTVTCRLPQLGHIRRDSSREIGKFGPRVATSVSRSSCLRYTQRLIDRVPSRKPLHRICTRQPRLRAIPNVATSMRTNVEHLDWPVKSPGGALWAEGHKLLILNCVAVWVRSPLPRPMSINPAAKPDIRSASLA